MLSCSDRQLRELMLERFQQVDPDLAGTIQRSVVGFERLQSLSDAEMLTLLRHVDTSHWAPALKNAPSSLVARVFKPMAPSVVALLQREIDEVGIVDGSLEDDSRRRIVEALVKLESEGKIRVPPKSRAA